MKKIIILLVGVYIICFSFSCRKKDKDECPVCPKVDALFPASGKKGDTILITGRNFSNVLLENRVTFNGVAVASTSMISGSSNELRVLVPGKCGTGPVEVKLDEELYSENGPVFTYNSQTTVIVFAGSSIKSSGNTPSGTTFANTRFKSPSQLAIDGSGNIYALDEGNYKISKLTVSTGITTVLTDSTSQVRNASAIAVDENNVLYISSYTYSMSAKAIIYKMTPGSTFPTYYSTDPEASKKHVTLAVEKPGEFFISRQTANLSIDLFDITHFTSAKGHQDFAGGAGTIIYLKNGVIYSINAISAHGLYQTEFSKFNVSDTVETPILDKTAGLNYSKGLVVDDAGNAYIADTQNNRIIKCSPTGVITELVTTGLSYPKGMVMDKAGNIYVADSGNNCIKKITFD